MITVLRIKLAIAHNMEADDPHLQSFHRCLQKSRRILCIVGSGLSASSGIPTYQLQHGTWHGYTALDLATPEAFQNDPGLVWLFYSSRRYEAMKAKPNEGHFALAELCRRYPSRMATFPPSTGGKGLSGDGSSKHYKNHDINGPPVSGGVSDTTFKGKSALVISQNVDGLHQRAGHPQNSLVELHGSLFDMKCTQFFCNYRTHNEYDLFLTPTLRTYTPRSSMKKRKRNLAKNSRLEKSPPPKRQRVDSDASVTDETTDLENVSHSSDDLSESTNSSQPDAFPTLDPQELPHCPKCHEGILRPAVVWFGESLPLRQMDQVDQFFSCGPPVDLVLVIGTSGKVWPAMGYVERVKKNGGKIAIFNTAIEDIEEVNKSKNVWGFQGDASKLLPEALKPLIGEHYKPRDWFRR